MERWSAISQGACRLGASVALLFGAQATWAAGTVCVGSDAALALALDDAQTTAKTIQLVQGTYHLDGSVWNVQGPTRAKFRGGSSLLGGYTTNCGGRDIDVDNTVITNSAAINPQINALGDATFEGITFKLKYGFEVNTDGNAAGSEVLFRRNVFTGTSAAESAALILEWTPGSASTGTMRLVDNLVHDNSNASSGVELGAITIFVDAGTPKIELVNNTVVDNNGTLEGVSIQNEVATPVYGYNNIFYGNAALDFVVDTGNKTVLVDNDVGTYFFPSPATAPVGTLRGDPKLDANFKPIESPASPVINAGTDNVTGGLPATDLPGRDREVGSEPDLGAYESSINDSLFQSVTNVNDSGVGSLRAAIAGANANGSSGAIITFDIGSTCGPHVITLLTPLPNVAAETHIYGFTQPGSSANSLDVGDNAATCIILDGATHAIADGFTVPATAADSTKLSVSGIAFSGFTHSALNLRGGVGHNVTGIRIGGAAGGTTLQNVSYGIILGPGVSGATIGGADDASRNIVGDAANDGIHIDGPSGSTAAANDNQIINNYVGVDYAGTAPIDSGNTASGISLAGFNNTIENNAVGFNTADGIHITGIGAHDNTITGNAIGAGKDGAVAGNGTGILIDSTGGGNDILNNTIANNAGAGVSIVGSTVNNSLLGTTFFDNGGLAIDLGGDGVTANDNDSQEIGQPNRKQNFPTVSSAIGEDFQGTVSGSVFTTPGDYTIQVFASPSCDASGHGEGTELVGTGTATVSGSILVQGQGAGDFTIPVVGFFVAGYTSISATATDANGNTSEFSPCFNYTDDQIFGNGFEKILF